MSSPKQPPDTESEEPSSRAAPAETSAIDTPPAKNDALSVEKEKESDDTSIASDEEREEGEADSDSEGSTEADTTSHRGANATEASRPPAQDPPLPSEADPEAATEDDGWEALFNQEVNAWYFYNRFTGQSTWENPRIQGATTSADPAAAPAAAPAPEDAPAAPLPPAGSVAGGYNPAIHGDYDPNAWYAQGANNGTNTDDNDAEGGTAQNAEIFVSGGYFNRGTGQFQRAEQGVGRHTDEAKSKRQMNAYFDVDAAANAHDGRSLKAERSGKRLSKNELKAYKEKRKAKKEEKRRAWLRD